MGSHKKSRKRSPSSTSEESSEEESPSKRRKRSSKSKKKSKKHKRDPSSSSDSSTSESSSSDSDSKKKRMKKHKKLKQEKKKTKKVIKTEEISSDIPLDLMEKSKTMAPMTKEEWEKKQSVVRRVYDESTGRHRLIKGDGEVIEEIVSRDRHKSINQQATRGDGDFFQSKITGVLKK